MRRIFLRSFLFVLFFSFLVNGVKAQEKKAYNVTCIGFYNLENLFDTIPGPNDTEFTPEGVNHWTSQRYYHKLNHMAEVISQIGDELFPGGPAILGVSEVENRSVLEDLVNMPKLKPSGYKIVHFDSPDHRGIDVALLYRPEFFKVTSERSVHLVIPDNPDFRTRDQLVVSGLLDGEPINIIVNHWPSRRGGEKRSLPYRKAAALLARSLIDSIRGVDPNAKVILMGDLNDDPDSKSVVSFLGAKGQRDNLKKNDLYDAMAELYRQGIGTLAYKDSWNLFDNLILTQPLLSKDRSSWVLFKAKVFNKPFLQQSSGQFAGYPFRTYVGSTFTGGYSDHFPVYLFLVKEKK
ncbi:MAG: endonuclease/exonuclease/phosphatase family protein [Bacteroidales bacterium]|nr:endonuclease/exonuclease/phosphatase family protein [Bacteroidales bacterium]HPD96357.1 endonuclease/exonuclease/phosphatase family protein [Tenuifilaceae bacterium]HRX31139.1 endonuclease/exonuclease/phosphatase family protein [Tenuifilaceae bacterium]